MAPTLAALLGVPPPAQAQGRAATELLDLPPAQRSEWERADSQRREEARARADVAFHARLAEERPAQFLRALAVAALVFAWLLFARGTFEAWRGPVSGLCTLFLVVVLFISFGRHASFSGWARSTLHAAGLSAVCTVLVLWLIGQASVAHGRARAVLASGVVLGFAAPAAVLFVAAGAFAPRVQCEPSAFAAGPLLAYAALCMNVAATAAWLLAGVLAHVRHGRTGPPEG